MPRSAEDAALEPVVRAAQAGDAGAFETLVRRFRGPLVSYARALLRDRGHAEDATQDALLHAWGRIGALRDPAAFRPWIYSILEHAALSGWRKRRRHAARSLRGGEAVAEGTPPGREEGGKEGPPPPPRREVAVLRVSLAHLAEGYREVLRLHYAEGRSARDIAGALGISLNNAKVRLYRARIALRREMARRGVTEREPARRAAS